MSALHIAKSGFSLPLDAVTQKFSILGRTGSGKSYCATKLCEEMLDAGAQVIALDPVGVWYGLRAGGHFSIPIFGGLHGDLPLDERAGEFMANLIVDRGICAVLDVSQFLSSGQAQFAYDFASRFFFRKKSSPSAVHLFVEECQEFVPQNISSGSRGGFEAKMLNAFERLIKLGRNFGIGATLISQRPQEVNKKALNQTECMFAFQMTGPQERKAVAAWVSDKAGAQEVVDMLPSLPVGVCHVWSPQWLKVDNTIEIAKKKSADVSSTPAAGRAAKAEVKQLSEKDLAALAKDMAATVERAKADDPRELKKEIVRLKRDLETALQNGRITPKPEKVEVPVIPPEVAKNLNAEVTRLQAVLDESRRDLERAVYQALEPIHSSLKIAYHKFSRSSEPSRAERPATLSRRMPDRPAPSPLEGGKTLAPRHQDIINAILFYHRLGISRCPKTQIAGFVTRPFNGNFRSDLAVLRTNSLIDYPTPGDVVLTREGVNMAEPLDIETQSELHEMWLRKLAPRHAEILRKLLELGEGVSRGKQDLASGLGREFNGNFRSDLSVLRTLGVIDYPSPGTVAVSENLYPPIPA